MPGKKPIKELMVKFSRRIFSVVLLSLVGSAVSPQAFSQGAPIKLIVGASAGGTTDMVARNLALHMAKQLNETVIVDNKPGAAGNIAARQVASATPDGKTLLVSYTSFSINPSLYSDLPFDPKKDFTAISMIATVPSVLVVRSDFPANNISDLIELAKNKPGEYTAALGGLGSSLQMATESMKMMAGLDVLSVPFKGSAPAVLALLSGEVDMMFASTQNVGSHVKEGTLKVLGVTSREPIAAFPDARPIAESISGFESYSWYGLFAPAGLPSDILDEYSETVQGIVQTDDFQKLFEADGGRATGSTPEGLSDFVDKDIEKYSAIVEATGMKVTN